MKKVLDRVVELLKEDPELRDDVILTRKKIWEADLLPMEKSLLISTDESLELERKGMITKSESIRRMWQLAQQRNPDLRGKNFDVRHGKKQAETKQEIKELNVMITQEKKEEKLEAIVVEGNPQTELHL